MKVNENNYGCELVYQDPATGELLSGLAGTLWVFWDLTILCLYVYKVMRVTKFLLNKLGPSRDYHLNRIKYIVGKIFVLTSIYSFLSYGIAFSWFIWNKFGFYGYIIRLVLEGFIANVIRAICTILMMEHNDNIYNKCVKYANKHWKCNRWCCCCCHVLDIEDENDESETTKTKSTIYDTGSNTIEMEVNPHESRFVSEMTLATTFETSTNSNRNQD